ncbi:microtubule-associated protein 70-5 [Impatiens glandulifera]|uniref:microtubule-associated protein 70-5 n=1 Tax=Impatiens glandulifera TaxID=253017 RepID=UPI001FB0D279|nr:microtubule-associated protein 70-5 [Impatiens glandulifera]
MGFDQEIGGGAEEILLNHPDPLVLELNRLQNQLKEKDRELGASLNVIKGLKGTEVLKDKAIEELANEFKKMDDKLRITENLLEQKNLEIKKLKDEKKEALAGQYAAEATLRRVHTNNQRDDDLVPIESILAPLESEIRMYKNEITSLQEDKKALERHTKSKEAALLEAEKILTSALERALIVEEVQNRNYELKRQIEICQEENKIMEKTNRQKVLEVEKLSQTIEELEEAILAGGMAANVARNFKRQISELQEEKRTLERELARVKVSANRVATVVANEWKDENDKVMPVKQWLEDRKLLQAETQRLRDKLVVSERTAKAEAQLKDKLKLRIKTLEDGLKNMSASQKAVKSVPLFGFLSGNSGTRKRSISQPISSIISSPAIQLNVQDENLLRKSLWTTRNKVADCGEKENKEINENEMSENGDDDDIVSGFLYDRLQKEVIALRKQFDMKVNNLNEKDEEIKMLMKKIDTLTKMKKESVTSCEKEMAMSTTKMGDGGKKDCNSKSVKRATKAG